MPCDAVYDITLNLGATDFNILCQSIEHLEELDKESVKIDKENKTINFKWKYGPVAIDHKTGKITVATGQETSVNMIKRNYSRKVIEKVSNRFGWMVKNKAKASQEQRVFVLKKR